MTTDAESDPAALAMRRRLRWPGATAVAVGLAGAWLALMLVAALFADQLAPFDYAAQQPLARFSPPSFLGGKPEFLLGTDALGRDLYSRLLYGIRLSIAVAALGTLIGALVGTTFGAVAAYARGLVDDLIMGLVDAQASLPLVIFALGLIAVFGTNLVLFVFIVGISGWERYARLTRGLILDATTSGYADALVSLGAGPVRTFVLHILPNIASALIVQMTINFPEVILLETGLSFLGFGIQPPLSSLGTMVSDGRINIYLAWWIVFFPALVIFLTTLAVSVIGDAARDRIDATLR
jgi:peptide/nickel transport system permease protein